MRVPRSLTYCQPARYGSRRTRAATPAPRVAQTHYAGQGPPLRSIDVRGSSDHRSEDGAELFTRIACGRVQDELPEHPTVCAGLERLG
jgi:hypothetical protein